MFVSSIVVNFGKAGCFAVDKLNRRKFVGSFRALGEGNVISIVRKTMKYDELTTILAG